MKHIYYKSPPQDMSIFLILKNTTFGSFPVVQWLILSAPSEGDQVRSLVRELDFTCCN